MGIDGINAAGQMPGGQMAGGMASIKSTDSVSKGIQNEISGIQQQMQELSSKKDIPVEEKMKKRQELQQEMRKLSAELRRRQEQISREQRKESTAAEKKKGSGAEKDTKEDDEKKSAEAAYAGFKAMISGDISVDQMKTRGIVVAQIEDGIAILKGEISQDELRGMNVDKKRSALEKQEEKAQKAAASQFSDIGETMRKTAQASDEKGKTKGSQDAKDRVLLKTTNYSKEESDEQKRFYVSVSAQESVVS